jgi:hypothetical protein
MLYQNKEGHKMRKKIAAWFLLGVLLTNFIPVELLANAQEPLSSDGIQFVTVGSIKSSVPEADITPSVTVEWLRAPENPLPFGGSWDDVNKKDADSYRFDLRDSLYPNVNISGDTRITAEANETKFVKNIQDSVKDPRYTNGKLYELKVIPAHKEIRLVGENYQTIYQEPSSTLSHPKKYFLTDFNTKAKDVDGKLEVSWEYIPGGQYQVVYIPADKKTKGEINSTSNEDVKPSKIPVSSAMARANLFTENGVSRVKTIINNADPGQLYSVYVELTGMDDINPFNIRFSDIVKNTSTSITGPKVVQKATQIDLKVFDVGSNDVRLEWTMPAWLRMNIGKLKEIRINQRIEGSDAADPIGSIFPTTAVEYYQYIRPTENTYFFVEFIIDGLEDLKTEEVLYVPGEATVRPLQPQVPKPFSEAITLTPENYKDYLVLNDDIARTHTAFIEHTFHTESSPAQIQLVWNAPKTYDSQNAEVIDYGQFYDIYVTEDRNQLNTAEPILSNIYVSSAQKDNLVLKQNNTTVVGFKWVLEHYRKSDNTQADLLPNKTYYIKIVAKRTYGDDYISSEPTIVNITIPQEGDIFTPPVLAKPPLKLSHTTTQSAVIRWLTEWYEIAVKDESLRDEYKDLDEAEGVLAQNWNPIVYTTDDYPPIRFKKAEDFTEHILKTDNELEIVREFTEDALPATTTYSALYIDRKVTLGSDSNYEIKVWDYDELNRTIKADNSVDSIEEWIAQKEISSTGWKSIAPYLAQGDPENDQLPWLEYTEEGLEANTRYVMMIRAYRTLADGTKRIQTFPSYVICTTLSGHESPEEIPKTPELHLDTKDDTSITVWWDYNASFDYEIVYSRLEDPDQATAWDFTLSNTPGEEGYVSDGAKASVKITGLTPETTYNIWIKAKQKIGIEKSHWSNPVTAATDALGIPAMPTGLGPAAYQSILELGQDFVPVAKDYITVEWIKNPNDIEDGEGTEGLEKQYSYTVEFADNPEFLDAVVVNTSGETEGEEADDTAYDILSKNMIKFTNLIANRPYYVKVKTVLTFKDEEGNREIVKESDYTKWVRILTKKSSDEYDGGENDNIVIYPDAIIEDYSKDIWTVEIADTAKIISDMMKKNDYFFTMKMEKFNNKYDAGIRRVKIPKNVVDTLINQGMELKIITNIGEYEIPAKTLAVYTNKYSAKDIVQFDFTKVIDYKITNIIRQYPETLLKGEQLDIAIKSKKGTSVVKKLDGYLKVKIKLDASQEYLYKDLFAYTYNFDLGGWTKENYSLDTLTDSYITYLTPVTGIYSVYEKLKTTSSNASTYAMKTLANTYNISGLGTIYFKNDIVTRDQFVHLLLGTAQNKGAVDLTASASSDSITKAKSAGLYIGSNTLVVTEEQAIAGIVKLYELKNGYKVKASSVKFNNVAQPYREAASKAYAIGLIETINPKASVTYGTLCDWILQVTE